MEGPALSHHLLFSLTVMLQEEHAYCQGRPVRICVQVYIGSCLQITIILKGGPAFSQLTTKVRANWEKDGTRFSSWLEH